MKGLKYLMNFVEKLFYQAFNNMEKIKIEIPDNLSPEDEAILLAKILEKKLLPSSNNKKIGSGYEMKKLETQIIIKRVSIEKPVITRECKVCDNIFAQNAGRVLWVNYGGKRQKKYYCSDDCLDFVLNIVGSHRAALRKLKLKQIRTY